MQLEDWLDDLCVRFIINLPPEELESVERICFQVEEAQWFYEDFIRPLDPTLPSLSLKAFSLRIFQHCPLFSQWSAQHYTTAFAEFLAYKSRVPVRGAIMLNDAMDEVVLVKGWKKGANWSFPRGKINKDERDLDCAVREVYEETGFDIEAAGLVKEEKDMKYIEVTMREQHMRLYVFRGVQKDTYFEPRTRKEISKIEWWKLTDLPTLKKHKHQDSNGDGPGINANKFYMVAPFITPLKKWIAQQRKKDNRQTLHTGYLAPVPVVEETATEDEPDQGDFASQPPLVTVTSHGPSDLPEVSISRTQTKVSDPSEHLKQLLKMNENPNERKIAAPRALPNYDAAKSSALLALLRGESTPELRAGPHTPLEQMSFPPEVPRSPHRHHPRPPPFSAMPPPPPFPVPPSSLDDQPFNPPRHRDAFDAPNVSQIPAMQQPLLRNTSSESNATPQVHRGSSSGPAQMSYQGGNDLGYFQRLSIEPQRPAGPPASALPTLTNHTKALLDMFKGDTSPHERAEDQAAPQLHTHETSPTTQLSWTPIAEASRPSAYRAFAPPSTSQNFPGLPDPTSGTQRPKSDHQANLLDLFRQSSPHNAQPPSGTSSSNKNKPAVELAANPAAANPNDHLLTLLQREKHGKRPIGAKHPPQRQPGEGETSATITGPLNLPQFEGIKGSGRFSHDLKRTPVPANRTLFDPNQPTPIKILTRPDDARRSPARSPRQPKSGAVGTSPKRQSMHKEPPKPFQPQILRRPQTAESQTGSSPTTPMRKTFEQSQEGGLETPEAKGDPLATQPTARNPPPEAHKQTLLSLFGKPSEIRPPSTVHATPPPHDMVSPLTASQLVSPLDNEAISTRSRVGSLASIASGGVRPPVEKRQTAAGDKAFLLGYLSRIASQES